MVTNRSAPTAPDERRVYVDFRPFPNLRAALTDLAAREDRSLAKTVELLVVHGLARSGRAGSTTLSSTARRAPECSERLAAVRRGRA